MTMNVKTHSLRMFCKMLISQRLDYSRDLQLMQSASYDSHALDNVLSIKKRARVF